jgi:hypothetical protein
VPAVNVERNKVRIAKQYDKNVKPKEFSEGDLVWKVILPIGTKGNEFGKWPPNWESPFCIARRVPSNAYILKILDEQEFARAINGRFLKRYYLSIEVNT